MCATICTFCKKSASKLVPHHLCDCCLVHLECCETTLDNRSAYLKNTVILDDDTDEKIDCGICLQSFPEDELEEHQEMCMACLVLRCSVCEGDYLSKEGLWNHLDLHEIAEESKELHYTEMRATYKLYKCDLCNDQRGYQESIYWRHVHEDHDGFFLRCMDCGANFRSEKRKADHALSLCHSWGKTEASVSTALGGDEELEDTIKPGQELLQKKVDQLEMSTTISEQKSDFERHPDSQVIKDSPSAVDCDYKNVDNAAKKLNVEEKISQANLESQSTETNDIICTVCSKWFSEDMALARHIEYCHQPFTCNICGITAENRNQIRYHKVKSHTEPKYKCKDCPKIFHLKSAFRHHLRKHEKETKISCKLCGRYFKHTPGLLKHMLQVHRSSSQTTIEHDKDSNAENSNNEKDKPVESILPEEEIALSDSSVQREARGDRSAVDEDKIPSEGTSRMDLKLINDSVDNKCTYCAKQCNDERDLSHHYIFCHKQTQCEICMKPILGMYRYRYHKLMHHTEPRHKCPHCPETFHHKIAFKRHLSRHQREIPCGLCELKFRTAHQVNLHKRRIHKAKSVKQKKSPCQISSQLISCPLCGNNFDDEDLLSTHVGEVHQRTICTSCGMTFASTRLLKAHKLKCHLISKYHCTDCPRKFVSEEQYLSHFETHKSLKKHEDLHHLKAQNKNHHESEQSIHVPQVQQDYSPNENCEKDSLVECEEIDIKHDILSSTAPITLPTSSTTESQLNQSVECLICGLTFANTARLKNHKLISHVKPRLKCPHCPKMFHYQYSLKLHEMRHNIKGSQHVKSDQSNTPSNQTASTDLVCKSCDKTFEDQYRFELHNLRNHCNSDFQCDYCDLKFPSHAKRYYHKLKAHTEPRFKCLQCPRSFYVEYRLRNHMAVHKKAPQPKKQSKSAEKNK